jgi:hypothetical protein
MTTSALSTWAPTDYCFGLSSAPASADLADLVSTVYPLVCRTALTAPGFCLIDLGDASSIELRRTLVGIIGALDEIHRASQGQTIAIKSAARFDQQVTTKLHRDGGPDRSLLLLGYEPSGIGSELLLADYSRCAADLGLTPREFLERHNPMYAAGEQRLVPYLTRVACFRTGHSQLVLINNSLSPALDEGPAWLGVLHAARVPQPSPQQRRVINSVMVASMPIGDSPGLTHDQISEFLTTNAVHRRGYDKPELADDA